MAQYGEIRIQTAISSAFEVSLQELGVEVGAWNRRLRRAARYRARIWRSRCPRSTRWRRGTRHTDHGTTYSDLGTANRHFETTQRWLTGLVVDGERYDLSANVSVFDGGTNHRVPSGPRRAASKAYREAQRGH